MKDKNEVVEGNYGRATPSLRYLHKTVKVIALKRYKGYFSKVCQNNLPEDFPNSK